MRAAVTGGAGFIGHNLVRRLLAEGHQVSVIDDFSTGARSRLTPFVNRIAVTEGSILDPAALDVTLRECDVVFHEAAIASVARSVLDPRLTSEVNISGTIEVMLAAARNGIRRVVYAGSSAVYGVPDELPCSENQRPDPQSPYGASKLAAEHYLHALGRLHGLETVALRYFNVFGPGQDPTSEYAAVVPRFITALLEGRRPVIYGNDEITRDFVYVDDVVAANLLASRPSDRQVLTCNVARGSPTSLRELIDAISAATGQDADPVIAAPRAGDIQDSYADVSLASRALGYRAKVTLAEGIAATVEWFRQAATIDSLS